MAPEILPEPVACDWDAIALDYAADVLSVEEICAAHSVTRSRLYRHAERYGWQMRRGRDRSASHGAEVELAERLLTALDVKMKQFESRLSEGAASATAADSERDARTLSTLVRLFEKLKVLGGDGEPADKRGRKSTPLAFGPASTSWKDAHDADRLRSELARRLEILRGQLGG